MRKFLLLFVFILSSCVAPQRLTLEESDFSNLKGWHNSHQDKALVAFKRSCEKLKSLPDGYNMGYIGGTAGDWKGVCARAGNVTGVSAKRFFEENFVPFKAGNNGKSKGLFTGYYEPELSGSKHKKGKYTEPVYKTPPDLTKPYLGRRRIGNGEIAGRGLEMLYVDNAVDLFFLHIQGSGRVRLDDGRVIRVGYAEQNGCPYQPIGKELVNMGEMDMEEVTAPKIKEWLYENPDKARDVMNKNTSYVFFRELKEIKPDEGPIGAQGVPLTAGHSLAVDKRFIPYGTPVWLQTHLPVDEQKPFNNLMIAQDTGGAIKGPVRGDIFFGFGKKAENLAGHMKQEGEYYILLPKKLAEKLDEDNNDS